jgi:hypothetical protein
LCHFNPQSDSSLRIDDNGERFMTPLDDMRFVSEPSR